MFLAWPYFRYAINREVRQDIAILGQLADKSTDIDGMKLSRFDKALGVTRERIRRIYKGEAD
jgi:CRISPR/Cas system CSM-associated protein Csm2 small subunit